MMRRHQPSYRNARNCGHLTMSVACAWRALCGGCMQIILPEDADWVREHREWQEQFQRRTRKQYPAEFWDKSRRGKVRQAHVV